jgi:DNA polymerase I-like protein with 3'-5' exonuclease and polymerase domains
MLLNCDVKGLEVVVAAQLSQDKVLMQEIINKVDTHANNQARFKLPDRVTAKRFIFKLLYGATAFGYSVDTDFLGVGFSQSQWQGVIDEFYSKYLGIANWHRAIILEAQTNGFLRIPSGRYYPIEPNYTKSQPWPITIIKNYPVQGFGADLVMLARLRAHQLITECNHIALPVGTVHDSLKYDVLDNSPEVVYNIGKLLKQSVEDVPSLVKKIWKYDFNLPLTAEIQFGKNFADMEEVKF